jgi:hypothetical protein
MAMQFEHAEHTLETIRTLMERSQRYEHISGYSGLVAGSAVLLGCAALRWLRLPFSHRGTFAVVWTAVFVFAFCSHCVLTFARARQRGEPVWSRQARTVLQAVLPGFVASVAVSVCLWRLDRLDLLPALWLMLYGCSALATSFFAPKSIRALGATCLAAGIIGLLLVPARPVLTMAVGFGLTHVVFGGCVLIAEWREERERTFWKTLEEA